MNCNMKSILKAIPVYLVVMSVLTLTCHAGGRVISFGYYTDLPAQNEDMIAVAAGYMHSLALTIMRRSWLGAITVAARLMFQARARMILKRLPRVVTTAWRLMTMVVHMPGDNSAGQVTVPSSARSNIRAISAGLLHSLALHKSGKIYAWGDTMFGQTYVPSGLDKVIAISAGALHSVALRNDGQVFIWGDNSFGQGVVPEQAMSEITSIAGYFHNLALTTDGEVIAGGDNTSGQ